MKAVNHEIERVICKTITGAAPEIADAFYNGMMTNPETHYFLKNDIVIQRLHASMVQWIKESFIPQSEKDLDAYLTRQKEIGSVHARINVPMNLVMEGMAILKYECFLRIEKTDLNRHDLMQAALRINETLDEAASLINGSYFTNVLENERGDQSLRLHVINHNLAIECERVRAGLFDWMRRVLVSLYKESSEQLIQIESIMHSEVGLWVIHKAELLFPDMLETRQLVEQLHVIDEGLKEALKARSAGKPEEFNILLAKLNDAVSRASWGLSALVEHVLEGEKARDPLTHVLSRRYLPGIMQREIKLSIQSGMPFAVLLIDIDHFKEINDSYGHPAGDVVLLGVSEVLRNTVRANDFVFRYGGEEFLVQISDVTEETAMEVAEKIRKNIQNHRFMLEHGHEISVTASIGVALHKGHPDYNHLIKKADAAMYEAKETGRNCSVLAE